MSPKYALGRPSADAAVFTASEEVAEEARKVEAERKDVKAKLLSSTVDDNVTAGT
jgi:hypothetical protein